VHLLSKHKNRSDDAISDLLAARVRGALDQPEWTYVVRYMYSERDARSVLAKVADDIAGAKHVEALEMRGKVTAAAYADWTKQQRQHAAEVPFGRFLQLLLTFQLHSHTAHLATFTKLFKGIDESGSGQLNAEGARRLVRTLSPHAHSDDVDEVLETLGFPERRTATYSMLVAALDSEIVDLEVVETARRASFRPRLQQTPRKKGTPQKEVSPTTPRSRGPGVLVVETTTSSRGGGGGGGGASRAASSSRRKSVASPAASTPGRRRSTLF
jgi:hypothetical protein